MRKAIEKWGMELATKPNGEIGIRVCKAKTAKQFETVKKIIDKFGKDNVIAELKVMDAERKAEWEIKKAKLEEERNKQKTEYLQTADLRRCLVFYEYEYGQMAWSIETLEYSAEKGRFYQANFGKSNLIKLHYAKLKDIIESASAGDGIEYGIGGVAWEISEEQEKEFVEAQRKAEKEIAIETAEEEASQKAEIEAQNKVREAEKAAKFEEAKKTGKSVILRQWTEDCNDPDEECSMDIVIQYAMPDGTTKIRRQHTW